jgi:hypothetical protein
MSRTLFLIFVILAHPFFVNAQVSPAEGSKLNYRIIGFTFPAKGRLSAYKLEIAAGNFYSADSFKRNIIKSLPAKKDSVIAEVPSFGAAYTWRVIYMGDHAKGLAGDLHHFSTGMIDNVDTALYRLRILKVAEKYKDALVFLDDNKVLYDMGGNPVWYLPAIDGASITPRDLKLSPQGTITFLFNPPYEINYDGKVLWKGPQKGIISKDFNENCHHEFTRLPNGHYMVLGTEYLPWKQKSAPAADTPKRTPFGTIIEYDGNDSIVWSWRSFSYLNNSDLNYYPLPEDTKVADAHENAFFFDEKNNVIYLSFKNISRIIKIKYPEGKVIAAYGETFLPGATERGNGLFCGQHACNRSQNGLLYVFNNNVCEPGELPKITVMREPDSDRDHLSKIWEYECTVEGISKEQKKNYRFISGGNVLELPDQSFFACMNGTYSKIFIVDRDKEILWSALAERKNKTTKKWDMAGQYRAFIIPDRKKFEQLIWNSAATK